MKQAKSKLYSVTISLCLLSILLLSACSNRFEEQLLHLHKETSAALITLKQQLDSNQLVNALLINKYARTLHQIKPNYADIASLLQQESTSSGKSFTALSKRLTAVSLKPNSEAIAAEGLQELQLILAAADPYEFNNALADVVNTLASLSDGQLALINVPSSQRAAAQNTNALVGNPAYGNWRQNSSGTSFWAWYGMYSMFSNVFGMNRYSYGAWSSRPHYSYYGNYGRNRWGSSADVNRNYNLSKRHPSKYNRANSATKSRYATTSKRASSFGGSSKQASSSRYSSYGSSSRSSSFSSARSFRSGK